MKKSLINKYLNELNEYDNLDIDSILGPGKSSTFTGEYDPEELKIGIEIEKEHTNNPKIAERIAKDHLSEIPDYYTRLIKMEKEACIKD